MRRLSIAAAVVFLALAVGVPPALATNGYFSHGYGTHYKGIAGAGVALPLDTMAAATNPAAMAFLGPRWDLGLAIFNPNRSYGVDGAPSGFPGTFGLTPGLFESGSNYFYNCSVQVDAVANQPLSTEGMVTIVGAEVGTPPAESNFIP